MDYTTLRRGFIRIHCKGNPKFNFHKYMMRALEADFKKVVGISWYLWLFLNIVLLLHAKALIPLILLLAVGTKLEHIIIQLAQEIAEKHEAIEGDLLVRPSNDHFWFHRPRLILILIHFILFQNSLEIALFFWIWFLCSYSTLPLYVLVSHMGSSLNKDGIFDEPMQEGLVHWANEARKNMALRQAAKNDTNQVSNMAGSSVTLELGKVDDHENKESAILDRSDSNADEIMPIGDSNEALK
ncbi:hypothetical protein Patl1_27148 [Pistacia atlantica]|uniref:Uncharacterized protein n=1 Tax=Pistacia atlantica TaxID=434234 RepID=A0ACC1AZ38_9ROSI|nr:hypothetical protein Patl1_27148 [Pistacia atlantica]